MRARRGDIKALCIGRNSCLCLGTAAELVVQERGIPLGYSTATGAHWTTDAIYRESIDDINRHRDSGVLGVDMETSAMYALGLVQGVEVANVLAVSDELWHDWNPAFGTHILENSLEQACQIALTAVSAS